jgi:hypothetical protein
MRVLLAVLFLLSATLPGSAAIRILGSPGGQIGKYLNLYAMIRQSGEKVIIDGPCYSACTLVLSVLPKERICVTRNAVLGFHAAWKPDMLGRPQSVPEATRIMYETYPSPVRRWIKKKGGLTAKPIMLRGRELSAMYRRCS